MLTPLMIQALENPSISLLATSQDECPQFPLTLKSMAQQTQTITSTVYHVTEMQSFWLPLSRPIKTEEKGSETPRCSIFSSL